MVGPEACESQAAEIPQLDLVLVEVVRLPELRLRCGKRQRRRHHADDLDTVPIDLDHPTDDTGVAAEARLPEPVAEDGHRRGAGTPILSGEDPAQPRRCAHHLEERRGHEGRLDSLRVLRAGEARLVLADQRHPVQGADLPRVEEVQRIRHRQLVELHHSGGVVREDDEPIGVRERKRTQQYRVHDGEDGEVGGDADRQRQHRDRREARAGGKTTQEHADR